MKRAFSFPNSITSKLLVLLMFLLLLVFVITFLNTDLFTRQIENNVRNHAIQVSDLIKGSTHYSMLKNHREDLANIISNIGREEGIEGIWIYDKYGEVRFASDSTALAITLEKDAEQCSFCHTAAQTKGVIPKENRIRHLRSESGDRILGLINPIENSKSCSEASCHAHSPDKKLLGLLDIQMSLKEADASAGNTRRSVLLMSGALIFLTALLFRSFIHRVIQRPISALIHGTQQVAAMNLDYSIPVDSRDELGYLSESFNKMTQELKRSNESIREWSETLEDKVQEKTEELERAQAHLILVEKMASLGKLAGVVAHEINNPMAGILTYAKLSIRNLSNSPQEKEIGDSIDNLAVIRDEAKRCGDIVKNLLLFSRKSYGEMSKQDIRPVIERSIELAKHSVKTKKVLLKQEIETGNTFLHCDTAALQQMMLVLLVNAIEAMPSEGGEVIVRLRDGEKDGTLLMEVSDNGNGISEEDAPHIFEPYYTTKDSAENTGLGLAVAYRIIVDHHHGRISVDSTVNEGTTFTIELPIDAPDATV
ncbi:HAMP domain-containing protein [bacterium]|nr:HAMP domain-containing protein [bacterium]